MITQNNFVTNIWWFGIMYVTKQISFQEKNNMFEILAVSAIVQNASDAQFSAYIYLRLNRKCLQFF